MGKVNCKCGNQISDVADPCINKGWLVSDIALDVHGEECCVDVIQHGVDVWECRECGALAFGKHKDNGIIWYYPESKPEQPLMERATP